MTRHKNFGNESQDARRHDQNRAEHPVGKDTPHQEKSEPKQDKNTHAKHHHKK